MIAHLIMYSPLLIIPKVRKMILYTSLLVTCFTLNNLNVIYAHLGPDHRCSHVPPPPDQVHHVWLNEANFTILDNDQNVDRKKEESLIAYNERHYEIRHQTKRQIHDSSSNGRDRSGRVMPDKMSEQDFAPRILFQQFGRSLNNEPLSRGNLAPMRIHVHYDSSVHSLEKEKSKLINEIVIPSVVEFFENALLIKKEYMIDKFRISRRCPNNTVHQIKNRNIISRPYCLDRCENHAICGEMIVPEEHLSACSFCNTSSGVCMTNDSSEGEGVANAQLLLYVSAKQTARCKNFQTIAYAAHCAQDTKSDRPVAGHANLCPSSISTDPKDLKALIATVKHELTHVLGFSVSLFAYYRDEHGVPLTERSSVGPIPVDPRTGYARWSERVIRKIIRPGWITGDGSKDKEVHVIVTPTVVKEVRRHFNCPSLEGAELEDQGSEGTSMTHWEKRLFENEAMTGTHTQNSVYSRLTLAMLQDTGWYVANFSRADKLEWGKDLGCDFAKKSCKSWIDERLAKRLSIRPFCDRVKGDLLQIGCTDDRSSKAVCNMRQYDEPLPGIYRNFDKLEGVHSHKLAYYGGSVDLADYCPFIQEFTWQAHNVTVRGSRCDLGNNIDTERNAALEHYGPDARCFEHGQRWEQRSCTLKRHWHHYGAGCYRYVCSNNHVSVIIGNQTYACYYPNQSLRIQQVAHNWLYEGTLLCPACENICPSSKCKHHNKRLIDRMMHYAQKSIMNNKTATTDDLILEILQDTPNSIELDPDSKWVAWQKYLAVNSSDPKKYKEYRRIKETLTQVLEGQKAIYGAKLLCSGAIGLLDTQQLIILNIFQALLTSVFLSTR